MTHNLFEYTEYHSNTAPSRQWQHPRKVGRVDYIIHIRLVNGIFRYVCVVDIERVVK